MTYFFCKKRRSIFFERHQYLKKNKTGGGTTLNRCVARCKTNSSINEWAILGTTTWRSSDQLSSLFFNYYYYILLFIVQLLLDTFFSRRLGEECPFLELSMAWVADRPITIWWHWFDSASTWTLRLWSSNKSFLVAQVAPSGKKQIQISPSGQIFYFLQKN